MHSSLVLYPSSDSIQSPVPGTQDHFLMRVFAEETGLFLHVVSHKVLSPKLPKILFSQPVSVQEYLERLDKKKRINISVVIPAEINIMFCIEICFIMYQQKK